MVLYVAPSPGDAGVAFVAGRKVGSAVERNRARRVLREAWRALGPAVRDHVVVLVAKPGIRGAGATELQEEVGELLARAGVLR